MRTRYAKLALLLALVVVAGAALILLHRTHGRVPAGSPPHAQPRERVAPAQLAALDGSLHALEDGAREAPRDRWDPDYIVAQVGRDPAALFRWTQENTNWIAYRGLLRGATGVLMDREGNSLDRAVLLGTLLTLAGHTVRLAHGELPRDRAVQLLPYLVAARLVPTAHDAAPEPGSSTDVRAVAADYHLDGAAVERALDAQQAALERLVDTLDQRVSDQTSRLLRAVGRPDSTADWAQRYDGALTSLQDHWWVQRQDGAAWADLDLLAPPDSMGNSLAPARETMSVGDLPDSLHHEIVVRVIAERWTSTGATEERVLESTLRPSELIGQPVVLQFWPGDWPSDVILATADRLKSFRTAALQQHRWSVALVAGRSIMSATLLESGQRESSGGSPLGGLGRGIGQGPQKLDAGGDASSHSGLTAVWLEYELRAPGTPVRPIRRAVFDLLGPAAREAKTPPHGLSEQQRLGRSLALMMRTEILPLTARFAPEFVQWLTSRSLLANRRLLHAVAGEALASGTAALDTVFAVSAPPTGPLYALALARFTLNPVDEIYVGHAGLLTRHQGPELTGGKVAMLDAIDVVANEVDVSLTEPDAFAVRLAQGVFETNAEALLPVTRGRVENAGVAYSGSQEWVTLSSQRPNEAAELHLSEDVRAQIRRELAAGYLVVAPREPVTREGQSYAAWWRIDPKTGSTLGMGEKGWGQMVDRAMLTDLAAYMAENFAFEYGLCQAIPQVENDLRFIGNVLQDHGWAPSWTKPAPKAVDPVELAKANDRVCVIQAIKMGILPTLPLVLITIRYTTGGRLVWNAALRRFVYNEIGGFKIPPKLVKGPIKGGPGKSGGSPTLPSVHVPEGAGTNPKGSPNPNPPKGSPGPGATVPGGTEPAANPNAKTQPDLGKTQPDLGKTQPGQPPAPSPGTPADASPSPATPDLQAAQENYDRATKAVGDALDALKRYEARHGGPEEFAGLQRSSAQDPALVGLERVAQQKVDQLSEAADQLRQAKAAAGQGPAPAPAPAPGTPAGSSASAQTEAGLGAIAAWWAELHM